MQPVVLAFRIDKIEQDLKKMHESQDNKEEDFQLKIAQL